MPTSTTTDGSTSAIWTAVKKKPFKTYKELNDKIESSTMVPSLQYKSYSDIYNFYYKKIVSPSSTVTEEEANASTWVVKQQNRFRLPKINWSTEELRTYPVSDALITFINKYLRTNTTFTETELEEGDEYIDYINEKIDESVDGLSEHENIEIIYESVLKNNINKNDNNSNKNDNDTLINIIDNAKLEDQISIKTSIKQLVILLYKIRRKYENNEYYDKINKRIMSHTTPQHLIVTYSNFYNRLSTHIHNIITFNNTLVHDLKIDNNPNTTQTINTLLPIITKAVSAYEEGNPLITDNEFLDDENILIHFAYILLNFNMLNEEGNISILEDQSIKQFFWFNNLIEKAYTQGNKNTEVETQLVNFEESNIMFGYNKFLFKLLDIIFNSSDSNESTDIINDKSYININGMTKSDYCRFDLINNYVEKDWKKLIICGAHRRTNNNLIIKTWFDYMNTLWEEYYYNPFNEDENYTGVSQGLTDKFNNFIYKTKCKNSTNNSKILYNKIYKHGMDGNYIKFQNLVLATSCAETFTNTIQERFQDVEVEDNLKSKLIAVAKKNNAIRLSLSTDTASTNTASTNKKSNIGMIVGSISGGVVLIVLILFLVLKKPKKIKSKKLKPKQNKKGKK
jgi:hypothetical protein